VLFSTSKVLVIAFGIVVIAVRMAVRGSGIAVSDSRTFSALRRA